MIKAALFPKFGPHPHTMLLQGGHFERTEPTLYGGRGEGTVKLSKKAKSTITFDQDCIYSEIWLQMSITSRGFYVFESNLDRKFLKAPFMYCWCIYGKRRILACILQHNNEVSRGKFWKMFYNRTNIEQITVKTRFIRHRWCRESTKTSKLIRSLSACFCFWWIHETENLQLQKSAAGTGR